MKIFRSNGPFPERPYFTMDDIELTCVEELQNMQLLPNAPKPIRIERFIEKRFKINVEYDDLEDGILGYTEFGQEGVKRMVISRELPDEGSMISERRINTTLAHEAGHGLLHSHLFSLTQNLQELFDNDIEDVTKPRILCRNTSILGINNKKVYDGRWWEYQANLVIGPILMPRHLVIEALDEHLTTSGVLETKSLETAKRAEAVETLAATFEVNPIVAKIRLESIFPPSESAQLTL